MKEWWVEYNMDDDGRPNNIRAFKDESEAKEFASTIKDARIVGIIWQ